MNRKPTHQPTLKLRYLSMNRYLTLAAFLFICSSAFAKTGPKQPEELGAITWLRDYELALVEAEKTGKPVLILFQEMPGCSNCATYGNNIHSQGAHRETLKVLTGVRNPAVGKLFKSSNVYRPQLINKGET